MILSVRQVCKTYQLRMGWGGHKQRIQALRNVSLDLQPATCLGIVGASGAGKSTLGKLVLGLERPDAGEIWFQGEELGHLSPPDWYRVRREMQVVFQDSFSAVNPRLKAQDIIAEPLRNYLNLTPSESTQRTIQLLETVGLTASDATKYPHQFSGGQLQRVTIARAIALKPKLIVLDEPVASLDMSIQAQILDLLLHLKQEFSLSYLFITHDLAAVAYLADTLAVMQAGEMVELLHHVDLNQLTHPYSQQLLAAQLPSHPRDRFHLLNPMSNLSHVNWPHWLHRWDAQQSGYLPFREERFQVMLDALALTLPESFTALDLACGPGAISQKLLSRFPQARCLAVDYDPILLAIGQGALGTVGDRLRWVEADLTQAHWIDVLGEAQVDAVLSTTALHWLSGDQLVKLYQQLGQLVRPGGVFLNGDHLSFPPYLSTCKRLAKTIQAQQEQQAFIKHDQENWEQWWQAIASEPDLKALFEERQRRFAPRFTENEPTLEIHVAALYEAGFREVTTIWQRWDDRILMAVR